MFVAAVESAVACYFIKSRIHAHSASALVVMASCVAIDQYTRGWQSFGVLALVALVSLIFGFVFSLRISLYVGYKEIDSAGNKT